MKKIGKHINIRIPALLILLLGCTFQLISQNVSFTATAKKTVESGEQFTLKYSVNAQGSQFVGPAIKGLHNLSGPNTSSSTSIQMVNGKTTQSVASTYSYILQADKPGNFSIPAAQVTVNGKKYKSNTLTVKVVKNSAPATKGAKNKNTNQGISDNDIFLEAQVNKKNPYQGEEVIVTYKLYTRTNISGLEEKKSPSNSGFWTYDLRKKNSRYKQYNQVINGQTYLSVEIRKEALFAQKSGKLTIDPMELICNIRVKVQNKGRRRNQIDNFFGNSFFGNYKDIKKSVRSKKLTINVKALPLKGKPSDFSGAVGNFSLKTHINKTELETNDASTLKLTVSGKGNIKLIGNPEISFSPDLETYDPKISHNTSATEAGISGVKSYEYLIIPRKAGEHKIPSWQFSFFDLKTKKYKTLSSTEYTLNVAKGENDQNQMIVSGVTQEDIQYIGSDIRHIKFENNRLQKKGSHLFGSWYYILAFLLPLLLVILFIIIWRKQLQQRSNISLMKLKRATKVSKKRLRKASDYLKENKRIEFYEEISQALWGYLSDKLSIPLAELSRENILEKLEQREIDATIKEQFIEVLDNCEFARFAPGTDDSAMDNIYADAAGIINKIENNLK